MPVYRISSHDDTVARSPTLDVLIGKEAFASSQEHLDSTGLTKRTKTSTVQVYWI